MDRFMTTRRMIIALVLVWTMIAALCILSTGCTATMRIKPVADMTPKEKSLAAIKIYNNQVDSYKIKLALPDLSAAEKKVLQVEYATFQKTWPVIKAYDDYVQGITTSVEEAVILQINQLILNYRY